MLIFPSMAKGKAESSIVSKLAPKVIACMLLGVGTVWLIVGLVIGIISEFDAGVFNPLFWPIAGALFLVGLIILIISLVKSKE